MPPPNITHFDAFAAEILTRLYGRFPEKTGIDCMRLAGETEFDEFGAMPPRAAIARETLAWLADEGYIRAEFAPAGATNAQLTRKGLEILRSVPASIGGKTPIGDRLTALAAAGAREAAMELIRLIFRHAG